MKIVKQEREDSTFLSNLCPGNVFQLLDALPVDWMVDHWSADDYYLLLDQPDNSSEIVEILNLTFPGAPNRIKVDSSTILVRPFDTKLIVTPKVVQ